MKELVSWLPAIVGILGLIVPYLMYRHIKLKDVALDIENDIEKAIKPVDTKLSELKTEFDKVDERFNKIDERLRKVETNVSEINGRFQGNYYG